ncbi:hypothetical protein O3W44_22725 [Pantoea sp. LMR881]|nr:hypothetical protein [Pantoea sp. LMR881]
MNFGAPGYRSQRRFPAQLQPIECQILPLLLPVGPLLARCHTIL